MTTKIVCSECRKPDDNMMLAVPRGGYADRRKAICTACYWNGVVEERHVEIFPDEADAVRAARERRDRADHYSGGYNRLRFKLVEMPSPIPDDIVKDWDVAPRKHEICNDPECPALEHPEDLHSH